MRLLRAALHDLDTAHLALERAAVSPPLRAWFRALQATPFVAMARASGAEAWLDSADARLRETEGAFSATSLPRQHSAHWLRRGQVARLRFERSGSDDWLATARASLENAASLAYARRDSLVLERANRERGLLEAAVRARGSRAR
jgi:hypothetical protein